MIVSVELNGVETEVDIQPDENGSLQVRFNGKCFPVEALHLPEGGLSMLVNGESLTAFRTGPTLYLSGFQYEVRTEDPLKKELIRSSGFDQREGAVLAAMPGNVKKILKQEGDAVEAGDGVVVLEAMKMENEMEAPKAGRVRALFVEEGQAVENGALLFEIEDEA